MQTERFEMRLDRNVLEQVDRWRASQPGLPSRAEAVRRLLHDGLAVWSDDEVRPNGTEKLILTLLCDLARDWDAERYRNIERIDPDFVKAAISAGHLWAFNWKYPAIFGGHPDSPELVREVVAILDMWDVLEHHYEQLGETDRGRVASEAEPFGTNVMFEGFYANEESPHLSIAEFLIKRLGRFPKFENRDLSSRWPVVDWYRRMLRVYVPMRKTLLGAGRYLSVSEIVSLLRERIHPDNRQEGLE